MVRIGLLLFALAILFSVNLLATTPEALTAGQPGVYPVGFTSMIVTDPSRAATAGYEGRAISISIWYPADLEGSPASEAAYQWDPLYMPALASTSSNWEIYGIDRAYQVPPVAAGGPFPLVMFSPGGGAKAWLHIGVAARLATHGFVVAVLTHDGDSIFPWEPPNARLSVASYHRPRDVVFALDTILALNDTPGGLLSGVIDASRIAAAGWSLGGYAALALAAGDDDVCDQFLDPPPEICGPTQPDPRIRALVLLDASNQILRFSELARVRIPTIGIGQEWSNVLDWQARQHAALTTRPAYRVDVSPMNHHGLSDLCPAVHVLGEVGMFPPDLVDFYLELSCVDVLPYPESLRIITQYATSFLETVLNGSSGYQPILTPGWALTREPNVEFFVTEKKSPQSIDEEWPGFFIYFMHQPGRQKAFGEKDPPAMKPVVSGFGGN
jgi:hypothetical protein